MAETAGESSSSRDALEAFPLCRKSLEYGASHLQRGLVLRPLVQVEAGGAELHLEDKRARLQLEAQPDAAPREERSAVPLELLATQGLQPNTHTNRSSVNPLLATAAPFFTRRSDAETKAPSARSEGRTRVCARHRDEDGRGSGWAKDSEESALLSLDASSPSPERFRSRRIPAHRYATHL
ncbi:hypothetical protein MRX96_022837 [Rhipicephalus microplus]